MHDLDELRRRAKALTADSDALISLAIDQHFAAKAVAEGLEELAAARSNGHLDLSAYRAPAIVDAIMALEDRRPALIRTWLDGKLEQRRGKRSGRCSGTPSTNGNGHAANSGAPVL